jgi:diketogulonate reductase-like aldo/keto reductase
MLAGRPVGVVGQGTWAMEHDRAASVDALRRGLDLGLNHVDTAEMYGDGEVERLVGEAIAGRRDEVYLVSKVLPHHASRTGTRKACEASLKRLGTDRLDLYLLHWPGSHPLRETIDAFEALRADGLVLAYGISNFDATGMEEAHRLSNGRVACNQVLYHLGERHVAARELSWCRRHGIALVAYSPYGQGDFPEARSAGGRVLAEVARRRGATARQVALAFLLADPEVLVIPKASRVAHVEENAGAADVELDAQDVAELARAFPVRARRELPTL